MIRKVEGGWKVLSEKGKNLGGPYKSREEAEERLAQVERFKHMKKGVVYYVVLEKGRGPDLKPRKRKLAEFHGKELIREKMARGVGSRPKPSLWEQHIQERMGKSKGFRMAKYTHKLGEEESKQARKERHGTWTPKSERMRELGKRRHEEQEGGEG